MNMPLEIPSSASSTIVSTIVKINGQVISNNYPLKSIEVFNQINEIASANLCFLDGGSGSSFFSISDTDTFLPGHLIEVMAGYRNQIDTIFKGIVIRQDIQLNSDGEGLFNVYCKHEATTMTLSRTRQTSNGSESEALATIISNYNMSSRVYPTSVKLGDIGQNALNDWDYIKIRAAAMGYFVVCGFDGALLYLAPPDLSKEHCFSLSLGSSILSFNASLDAGNQTPSLALSAIDRVTSAPMTIRAGEPIVNRQGNHNTETFSSAINKNEFNIKLNEFVDREGLKMQADALLLKMRLQSLYGSVSFFGIAGVNPTDIIELKGMGLRFSGNIFVSSVRQLIEGGNWTTAIDFGLKPDHEALFNL